MFDFTNSSIDILILVLRIAVVLLLYFFLWQVLRFVLRDLRVGGQPSSDGAARVATGNGAAAINSTAVMMHFAREAAMRILPCLFLNVQSAGMLVWRI